MGSPGPLFDTRQSGRVTLAVKSIKLRHVMPVQGGFARRSAGMKPAERLV